MNLEAIIARMKEIQAELAKPEANVTELRTEFDKLKADREKMEKDTADRAKLLGDIANQDVGVVIRKFNDTKESKSAEDVLKSDAYKSAFIKDLLEQDLTVEERSAMDIVTRAFIHTTANTAAVVPETMTNMIYSTMEEAHPLMADIQILRTGTVMTIVKHTAIVAGDAKNVAEGVANDDEQNTFVNVTLSGQDISKHVDYSYRLGKMAIPAFEAYLVKEIGDRIGSKWSANIVAQIKSDLAAANKFPAATPGTLVIADVLSGLGKLKGVAKSTVYVNGATLWGKLYPMKGADGLTAFIPNYADNLSGVLLGKAVKQEDSLADNEVLILDPSQYIENVVQDLLIERDKDIKKHVYTISGIVIAGGTMTNDKAGAVITIGSGT